VPALVLLAGLSPWPRPPPRTRSGRQKAPEHPFTTGVGGHKIGALLDWLKDAVDAVLLPPKGADVSTGYGNPGGQAAQAGPNDPQAVPNRAAPAAADAATTPRCSSARRCRGRRPAPRPAAPRAGVALPSRHPLVRPATRQGARGEPWRRRRRASRCPSGMRGRRLHGPGPTPRPTRPRRGRRLGQVLTGPRLSWRRPPAGGPASQPRWAVR
jgi:hypothetical protein